MFLYLESTNFYPKNGIEIIRDHQTIILTRANVNTLNQVDYVDLIKKIMNSDSDPRNVISANNCPSGNQQPGANKGQYNLNVMEPSKADVGTLAEEIKVNKAKETEFINIFIYKK